MAKKAAKKQQSWSTRFIRYTLSADDKREIPAFKAKNAKEFDALFNEVLASGHKISFSFNETNDTFICTVTGKPEECVNAGLCYTSFAGNYTDAAWVALYKFHHVWEAGAWADVEESEDFG